MREWSFEQNQILLDTFAKYLQRHPDSVNTVRLVPHCMCHKPLPRYKIITPPVHKHVVCQLRLGALIFLLILI